MTRQSFTYAGHSGLTRQDIAQHRLFPEIERRIAKHLIEIHRVTPRLSRLKASHRKWLMTHAVFALALRRREDDPLSGLTATRFIEAVLQMGAASRNTAAAFLAELVAYKFLEDRPSDLDRRVRVLVPTQTSLTGMRSWFAGHLDCLDMLDNGNRRAISDANPELFIHAQPLIANRLCAHPAWRNPPESISHFLNSDMGGLILHDLIARVPDQPDETGMYCIGPTSLAKLGDQYLVSSTNLKRMFKKAESEELLHWDQARRRGELWLTKQFVEDYYAWQATKFEGIDVTFWQACDMAGILPQLPELASNAA